MHHLIRLSLPVLALSFAVATPQIARAQQDDNPSTPGQIPNPGTYQGSQELQRQSDQQDQQFRQQQQQQQSQPYGGQDGGSQRAPQYGSNGGGSYVTPLKRCNQAMERSPAFARLRGLVELGGPSGDPRYFSISRGATNAEKSVLLKWLAARRHCQTMANGFSPAMQQMNSRSAQITDKMILELAQGRGTYGGFAMTRAHNSQVLMNFAQSH